ncbi:nitrate- and nitrite sensing domain-containing protein, partial [Streptomyces lydicus]|uniref:nitrate- and nitrite sensing domain-containing protein n=1 Tax=Streptomyces lydicus TaxID=47763 RepID=UPI003330FF0E
MRLRGGAGKPGSPAGSIAGPGKGPLSGKGPGTAVDDLAGRRPARVRNRLVGAVAVVAAAVLGAGAPGLAATADDANGSQQLVDLAQLNARAVALSHSLADERDGMTAYAAAGHAARTGTGTGGTGLNGTGVNATGAAVGTTGTNGTGTHATGTNGTATRAGTGGARAQAAVSADSAVSRTQQARVDRQIDELRSEAQDASGDTPAYRAAARLLATLPQTRHQALSGTDTPEQVYNAYTGILQALGAIGDGIARGLPARADAAAADVRALPALGRAQEGVRQGQPGLGADPARQ